MPVDFQVMPSASAGQVEQHSVKLRLVEVVLAYVGYDYGVELQPFRQNDGTDNNVGLYLLLAI